MMGLITNKAFEGAELNLTVAYSGLLECIIKESCLD